MVEQITKPMRFDASLSFDIGSSYACFDREPLGGLSAYFTLVSPELGAEGNPAHIRLGGRVGASLYFVPTHEFVDVSQENLLAKKCRIPEDTSAYGVRIFAGPEVDIPMADMVSLRFSPGGVFRYDTSLGFKAGAAITTSLIVDLASWATFMLHFTSDLYMQSDTQQFIFGAGFGFRI
jgi:hypothetical protein